MIPLWHFKRDPNGYDAHIVWPFVHVRNRETKSGWRLWPLLGSYRDTTTQEHYRFIAWPFGHDWRDSRANERFQTLFPLYMYAGFPEEHYFLSPLAAAASSFSARWPMRAGPNKDADTICFPFIPPRNTPTVRIGPPCFTDTEPAQAMLPAGVMQRPSSFRDTARTGIA